MISSNGKQVFKMENILFQKSQVLLFCFLCVYVGVVLCVYSVLLSRVIQASLHNFLLSFIACALLGRFSYDDSVAVVLTKITTRLWKVGTTTSPIVSGGRRNTQFMLLKDLMCRDVTHVSHKATEVHTEVALT